MGDFNTTLTSMNRSSRQKTNKATEVSNDTINQLDLINIYRTLHLKKPEYTFFSSAYKMFSRIDHILGHKTSLNKVKRIEIISSIFFPTTKYKTRSQLQKEKGEKNKHIESQKHDQLLLKSQWVNDKIKEEIRKYLKTNENENENTTL